LIGQCKFSNCSHQTEPGCAIRRALEDGALSPERWEMYARLEKENRWSMDRKNDQMVNIALRRRELNHSGKKRGR
jgi:ribosome biogenesis GTPase